MAERYWIGVVSREHVRRGVAGGFAQLGHGKASPLRRLQPGDWLIYYSPQTALAAGEPLQAFTAIGRVGDDEVFQVDMGGGFRPWRRRVDYRPCTEAPIRPLLPELAFVPDQTRWGYVFRRGLIEIAAGDFNRIARAMGAGAVVDGSRRHD